MRVLNLYAGLGGNRLKWPSDVGVTAVEYTEKIAAKYQELHPDDQVVVSDAHDYLLHSDLTSKDLVWSSPPCQSHSRMIRGGRNRKPRYPDLRLYEEILYLQHNTPEGCYWVVENVIPYYDYLIEPTAIIGRHVFWANFFISDDFEAPHFPDMMNATNVKASERLKEWLGLSYEGNIYYEGNHCPAQVLRNCVHPELGLHIYNCFLKAKGEL